MIIRNVLVDGGEACPHISETGVWITWNNNNRLDILFIDGRRDGDGL